MIEAAEQRREIKRNSLEKKNKVNARISCVWEIKPTEWHATKFTQLGLTDFLCTATSSLYILKFKLQQFDYKGYNCFFLLICNCCVNKSIIETARDKIAKLSIKSLILKN